MGLFGLGKKKQAESALKELDEAKDLGEMCNVLLKNGIISTPKDNNHNCFGQRMDVLDKDGDLPFGWEAHNSTFAKTQREKIYSAYDPVLAAVKTTDKLACFKRYFEVVNEVGSVCKKAGATHYKWFTYHIIESEWYCGQVSQYKQLKEDAPRLIAREKWLEDIEKKVIERLPDYNGCMQSDFVKTFAQNEQSYVRIVISNAEKDGIISREKSGRSYKLFLK